MEGVGARKHLNKHKKYIDTTLPLCLAELQNIFLDNTRHGKSAVYVLASLANSEFKSLNLYRCADNRTKKMTFNNTVVVVVVVVTPPFPRSHFQ